MGLFDIVRDKVTELLSGASDKVTELTGAELPGAEATDQLAQSADNLADTATGAAQDLTGSASEAVDSAITDATDPNR
jgi:hypothetical protein